VDVRGPRSVIIGRDADPGRRRVSEAIALVALAACLVAAVARRREAPDWAVAGVAAAVVLAVGAIGIDGVGHALSRLGPTIGFLAALLVLADGCRRAGVFEALGAAMAIGARGRPRRLLALVFAAAAATTAVLSLDATVVLLTPIVFATAARLPARPRPHVYACTHLANSASLLLPVSNLTNLLAFAACGIAFTRFAVLMALPWAVALAIEWVVLSRVFADDLRPPPDPRTHADEPHPELPRLALAIVALTLAGFAVSSVVGVAPVWFATAGAIAITIARPPESVRSLVVAAEPTFLVFVAGLGIVVAAAGAHGLSSVVRSALPSGTSLPALLAVAGISAVLANLVNNLPATLIVVAVVSASAPGAVLAMLIGVNVGPNLTYVGSLATLLWRRIIHAHDEQVDTVRFLKLGAMTVPATVLASTVALWLALQVI
jgi:arsenical pump membrane protein